MLLAGTARLFYIIRQQSQINMQLLSLRQKLMNLQTYAASVGNGVAVDDMINCPSELFQRMCIFKNYSNQASYAQAQQNLPMILAMNQQAFSQIQPQYQQQYQQMMFQSLFQKAQEDFGKKEQKLLNVQETKIQQQVAQLETQGTMLEEEKKNLKEKIANDAKDSASKYA